MKHFINKDDALSTIIVESKNLSRIFSVVQTWGEGDNRKISSLLKDEERIQDIQECLDNINSALEALDI